MVVALIVICLIIITIATGISDSGEHPPHNDDE
jgi:hypothetical protein